MINNTLTQGARMTKNAIVTVETGIVFSNDSGVLTNTSGIINVAGGTFNTRAFINSGEINVTNNGVMNLFGDITDAASTGSILFDIRLLQTGDWRCNRQFIKVRI